MAKNSHISNFNKRDIESVTLVASIEAPNNVTPSHGVVVKRDTVTNVTHVTMSRMSRFILLTQPNPRVFDIYQFPFHECLHPPVECLSSGVCLDTRHFS